ncbi:MAG: phosphoenolpyruvate--protein phosphotransferase [Candidatus Hydrogenedentota bacterium]
MEIKLKGIPVSPSVAIGPAYPFHVSTISVQRFTVNDTAVELKRLETAFATSRDELIVLRDQTQEELGEQHASIFHSHLDMLEDIAFRPEIERRLKEENLNVEFLVQDLIDRYTKMMEQIDDPLFRERSMDFVDIGRRVLNNLTHAETETLETLERPSIVVAHDLSPSETANMDMPNTLGIVTNEGGPTSHMAILARAFDIPSVVGLQTVTKLVSADDTIIIDGTRGVVIIDPLPETLAFYEKEKARIEAERLAITQSAIEGPCLTQDGHEIQTFANIELLAETRNSIAAHCQGVGLYRTEFLYMNRPSLPGEDEQFHSYRKVLEAMAPLPVTMRTLDLGGDKVMPHLQREVEPNPQLGWRSIRMCLDRPDIFKAQLRAMLRASVFGKMRIMFPMITGIDQFREARDIVDQVIADLTARGVEFNPDVEIGSMIEVPAAATIADKLAEECDFFCIGTNDLIQYCLAADRVNPRTAELYQPTHMAVLRTVKHILDEARKAQISCTICGEMAGDPMLTELLVGMGADSLSMSSVSLPMVRAEIANTRLPTAKRLAKKILDMGSVSEITAFLQERHDSRDTINLLRHKVNVAQKD